MLQYFSILLLVLLARAESDEKARLVRRQVVSSPIGASTGQAGVPNAGGLGVQTGQAGVGSGSVGGAGVGASPVGGGVGVGPATGVAGNGQVRKRRTTDPVAQGAHMVNRGQRMSTHMGVENGEMHKRQVVADTISDPTGQVALQNEGPVATSGVGVQPGVGIGVQPGVGVGLGVAG